MPLLDPRSADPAPPRVPSRQAPAGRAAVAAAPPEAAFRVERLGFADALAHRDAWIDLVDRALEPNAFLDPDFALPAAQHISGGQRPCFVLVWATGADGSRDLVAVCPVLRRGAPLRLPPSAWMHDLSTLGFPLLDRDRARQALRILLEWAGREMPGAAALVIPSLPLDGPTAAALREVAAADGRDLSVLAAWERAALRRGSGRAGAAALSPKTAKELRRQRRRLGERGELVYGETDDPDAVRSAVERFLALEAGGWKGRAGTALLCRPGRTAFARTALRLLARRRLCRVASLTLDGEPVAMAVILTAGAVDFLWKIAYREDIARLSPGVQLVLEFTEAQRRAGGGALTDSCAVPGHPMIERLWRSRIRLCDLAVALRPGRSLGFRAAVASERAGRRLRAGVKRLVHAWRARRRTSAPASP